jgi:hypothetical protein
LALPFLSPEYHRARFPECRQCNRSRSISHGRHSEGSDDEWVLRGQKQVRFFRFAALLGDQFPHFFESALDGHRGLLEGVKQIV